MSRESDPGSCIARNGISPPYDWVLEQLEPFRGSSSTQPDMSKVPTCLILDFHDSYTRNVLKLVEQLRGWDLGGWEQRVIVVNVDSLSW